MLRALLVAMLVPAPAFADETTFKPPHIVPMNEPDGTLALRIWGVEPPNVLALLGFRDGDLIEAVNEMEFSTPSKALENYARLRGVDTVRIRVNRNGTRIVFTFHIV
jgi:type II secretory pathway component PulC